MQPITIKHTTNCIRFSAQLINRSFERLTNKPHRTTINSPHTTSLSTSTEISLTSRSLSTSSSDMSIDPFDQSPSPIILSSTYKLHTPPNPFNNQDILSHLIEFISPQDRPSLLLINKSIRPLINKYLRLILTTADLPQQPYFPLSFLDFIQSFQKLQFLQSHNLKIKIQILPDQNIQDLYNFLTNPINQPLLNSIEVLQFHDVNSQNVLTTQTILNLLSSKEIKLPNLISISFRDIWADLNILNLHGILFFHCNDIYADLSLSNLTALLSLSSGSIFKKFCLSNLPNLQSLNFKDFQKHSSLSLLQLPNLKYLSFSKVFNPNILKDLQLHQTQIHIKEMNQAIENSIKQLS